MIPSAPGVGWQAILAGPSTGPLRAVRPSPDPVRPSLPGRGCPNELARPSSPRARLSGSGRLGGGQPCEERRAPAGPGRPGATAPAKRLPRRVTGRMQAGVATAPVPA